MSSLSQVTKPCLILAAIFTGVILRLSLSPFVALCGQRTLRALRLALAASTTVLAASAQQPSHAPQELTSDNCLEVASGETVFFHWSPLFDPAGEVYGLSRFELGFATESEKRAHRAPTPALYLTADPRQSNHRPNDANSEIQAEPNGYYRMALHVNAEGLAPGKYVLLQAEARPMLAPHHQGNTPRMTNSPLRYNYCINLVSRRGRHS